MATVPWITKGLVGVAGVSAVGVGGIVVHQGYLSGENKTPDELAFSENETHLSWKIEAKNEGDLTKVSVIGYKSGILNSKEWVCHIVGKAAEGKGKNIGDTKKQIEDALGIKDLKLNITRLEKFIKNCKRHRTAVPTGNKYESTIDLGDLKADSDKYKFDDAEVTKLHNTDYISKVLKAKLVIPDDCDVAVGSEKKCNLNAEALKKVRFLGKTPGETTTTTDGKTVDLKIEEISENNFPNNLKFTFIAAEDVQVKSSESDGTPLNLKKGANTEFKVENNGNGSYSLGRTWKIRNMAEKIGLTCPKSEENSNACDLKVGSTINVWNSDGSYIIGATFTGDITFAEDQQDHNQGFKFTTTADITLTESTGAIKEGSDLKIEKSNASYEIKLKKVPNVEKPTWFLSKVTPAA